MDEDLKADAAGSHLSGAMIALMPSAADAERLALAGGEYADQLHLTLFFLGEGEDWDQEARDEIVRLVAMGAEHLGPISARAFGASHWNPQGDSPVWVWNVSDDREGGPCSTLKDAFLEAQFALEDRHGGPAVPEQYTPWSPHITAVYDSADRMAELAERCGPVVFDRIRLAFAGDFYDLHLEDDPGYPEADPAEPVEMPSTVWWSTHEPYGLAFEDEETGDGRIFAPGALYWSDGPWPLQYADQMLGGHDGAELAGCIDGMDRDGGRIAGYGKMYLFKDAGREAAQLLSQGAPLGVSVDLDDVTVELVDRTGLVASVTGDLSAAVLPLPEGGWWISLTAAELSASVHTETRAVFKVEADCRMPEGVLTAGAGDPDNGGVAVHTQSTEDVLMRITRGRIRGATLVSIPAFAGARIELDEMVAAPAAPDPELVASGEDAMFHLVDVVTAADRPLSVADVAHTVGLPTESVRMHLSRAEGEGLLVKLARGVYVGRIESLTAAASGDTGLPLADREREWDGDAAQSRVLSWADGDGGKLGRAFFWRDPEGDPSKASAYKLGFADVIDGELTAVPRGVFAAAGALEGARGGVMIPEADVDGVEGKVEAVYAKMREKFDDPSIQVPWAEQSASAAEYEDAGYESLVASAWNALSGMPPMPASWFSEPTVEELPPGGPGMNYADGRVFGWVAQAGEPHAGYAKKITIESLGRIDTTHFLRQRFGLDDGTDVKAGVLTMNTGHHRDGAECETNACAFDDSRTVAAIVTVGMNERGMWFSGAAHPALSEWDRRVFHALQPSYHLRQNGGGLWQLRGVLAVPVPGHSSPLLASAVIERTNLALTASAVEAETRIEPEPETETEPEAVAAAVPDLDYARLADEIVASMARAEAKAQAEAEELAELRAAAADMLVDAPTGTTD